MDYSSIYQRLKEQFEETKKHFEENKRMLAMAYMQDLMQKAPLNDDHHALTTRASQLIGMFDLPSEEAGRIATRADLDYKGPRDPGHM